MVWHLFATKLETAEITKPDRKLQFTVDKKTKRSYIELEELVRPGGLSFKSHYIG